MEHYDDCYRNGSPSHLGICPECGEYNGTCYNDLCERCAKDVPILCPQCEHLVDYEDMTSHGICVVCFELNAAKYTKDEAFTRTFLYLTK